MIASKAARVLFAALLAIGLVPTATLAQPQTAEAAGTCYVQRGDWIYYSNNRTNDFSIDGEIGYCVEPDKVGPSTGTYSTSELQPYSGGNTVATWQVLYFGYGGPGYQQGLDSGLWPATDIFGRPMSNELRQACTHIMLAETYTGSAEQALAKCEFSFTNWAKKNILYGGSGNPNTETGIRNLANSMGLTSVQAFRDIGFNAFQVNPNNGRQIVVSYTYNPGGYVGVDKDSSNTDLTDGNALYSLAGAQYGVYGSWDDANNRANAKATLTTDAEGRATSDLLPMGTYYVRETKASTGYALDDTIYSVSVTSGQTTWAGTGGKVYDAPQNDPTVMWVGKIDLETTQNMPQGSASLAGAEFTVRYYDGQYGTVEAAEASGAPTRTWVVKTNEQGEAILDEAFLVSGDDFYTNSNGAPTIPLGTVLIQETKAPEGYLLPDPAPVYVRNVTTDGILESVEVYNAPTQPEEVMRGGVVIQKTDAETDGDALGSATLEGAVFRIVNESANSVVIDGTEVAPGGTIVDITTDEGGYANTRTDLLPYGDYSATEIVAPDGYLGTDAKVEFSITADKQIVELYGDQGFQNQVKRGDLEFGKKDEASGTSMANIPFRIASETTGESHVIVTDANGQASTAASWNAHSTDTNGNDDAVDGEYDSESGIWFGVDAGAAVDDSLGALPYDTYTLEELPCLANAGRELIEQTGIVISRNNVTVDLGTLDDITPAISTTATDAADGDKTVAMGQSAKVIDRVSYSGLVPGDTYTLKGYMVLTGSAERLEFAGEAVEASVEFSPTAPAGTVEVVFDLSGTVGLLPNAEEFNATVYEELYKDGRLMAEHKVLEDSGQTVRFVSPTLGTVAVDGIDGDKVIATDTAANISDTVSYRNLEEGAQYRIVTAAVAYDKASEVTADNISAALGTSEATFTAQEGFGTVETSVAFDATALDDGAKVVIFEWVYDVAGNLVAVHADAEATSQAVTIERPVIGTTASDAADGDQELVVDGSREVSIIDIVSFDNLIPGREYSVTGMLMDKTTGDAVKDAEGNPVTSTVAFTPAVSSGTVEVPFTFDPSAIPTGGEVVVFENLCLDGVEVAVHADIDDAGQTVIVTRAEIGTTATDAVDGDKYLVTDPVATINDSVLVQGVIAGEEYTAMGILMDAETGLPFIQGEASEADIEAVSAWWSEVKAALGMDGENPAMPASIDAAALEALMAEDIASRVVCGDSAFTLNDDWGTVDVAFGPFDASQLESGDRLVVFEAVANMEGSLVVAVHADIVDEGQTVTVTEPGIGTTAVDGLDGDKNVVGDPETTIVDTVEYSNVIPGRTYSLTGTLMVKSTGEAVTDAEDNPVTATVEFVPEHESGTVDVKFGPFDSSQLIGDAIVAFETLYADGVELAIHADIEDADQTVEVTAPAIDTVAVDGVDGDKEVVVDPEAKIVDTLSYTNVVPGEYTAHAILMDAETGLPMLFGEGAAEITEVELRAFWNNLVELIDVQRVEPADEGTEEGAEGSEGADEGYETVLPDDSSIATIIELASELEGAGEGTESDESGDAAADDGAEEGAEEEGQESDLPVIPTVADWDGVIDLLEKNPVIAEAIAFDIVQFDAEAAAGEVQADFGIDASGLAGKQAVVFQVLTRADSNGTEWTVAAHDAIDDADQTVDIVASEIGTEATDKTDGDHEVMNSATAVVVDTVTYTNLIPGKEYELKGQLMNKETGKVLISNDKPVEASVTFVPNTPDGTVQLEFAFDATALEGAELVAFEHLYKDGIEVATHADINDAAQTVKVTAPPIGDKYAKAGVDLMPIVAGAAVAAVVGGSLIAYGIRRKAVDGAAEAAAVEAAEGKDAE